MQSIFNQDEEDTLLDHIFLPNLLPQITNLVDAGGRFIHYTTAEVAMSIIHNRSMWMRNAKTMNDWSEVKHGLACVCDGWRSPSGQAYQAQIEHLHSGLAAEVAGQFDRWIPDMETNTYLTCVSEHPVEEDAFGRLSMWRAYGGRTGVGLVLAIHPFASVEDLLKAYTSPVAYETKEGVEWRFRYMAGMLEKHRDFLRRYERTHIRELVFNTLRFMSLCTKHPLSRRSENGESYTRPTSRLRPLSNPQSRWSVACPK